MTMHRSLTWALRGTLVFGLLGFVPAAATALCVAQTMSGEWINSNANGLIKRVTIEFKCCDVFVNGRPSCNPPNDTVKFSMPCGANKACDVAAIAHYLFVDDATGAQTTRMDARVKGTSEMREFVVLLLPDGRLMVHWSVKYPSGASTQSFSLVEYFERRTCITYNGQQFCFPFVRPLQRREQ